MTREASSAQGATDPSDSSPSTRRSVHVTPDAATLMRDTAERILSFSRESIQRQGVFHLALSGGHTPNELFRLLATDPYAQQYDWSHIHLWWSDERYLSMDDPECNFNMAYQALISKIPIPADHVHRVQVNLAVAEAAAHYEREIVEIIGVSESDHASSGPSPESHPASLPHFDVILLGLGEDGHTASCFPGTVAHFMPGRLVVSHYVPQVQMWRITFTPAFINAARHVIFLVSGQNKAAILQRVLNGPYQPELLPAQYVAPAHGEVTWMVDRAAAMEFNHASSSTPGQSAA